VLGSLIANALDRRYGEKRGGGFLEFINWKVFVTWGRAVERAQDVARLLVQATKYAYGQICDGIIATRDWAVFKAELYRLALSGWWLQVLKSYSKHRNSAQVALTSFIKARPSPLLYDDSRRRALIVALTLSTWLIAIGVRLFYLQTVEHEWLKEHAQRQQQDVIETSPVRGLILDRQGRELARNINTESFFIAPGEIQDIEGTAKLLSPFARVNADVLATRLRKAQKDKLEFTWVARKLDDTSAEDLKALKLKGVYSQQESKRHYPNGPLAAHVLGFVGTDEVALGGIEQSYDEHIQGEAGKVIVERNARGEHYASSKVDAHPGQSIVLTIDEKVQYRTEQALLAGVERSRARSGTAIVLDSRKGDILALASAPTFDPNYMPYSSAQARANLALQYIYEPGSTFTFVAYSAAIEKGLVKPDDHIAGDQAVAGAMAKSSRLAKSSKVAAIKLGESLGGEQMYEYVKRFGFGEKTGVELPGETNGLVRPVERWQPSSVGSIAIGQEVGVTPIQMAAAFASVANDGLRTSPHLVREIRGASGSLVYQSQPGQHRVVSTETAQQLRHMLQSVTLEGTAKQAQLDGYTAAGELGMAQLFDLKTKTYSKTRHVGSFVGLAPVENPSVVIIVVVDEPAKGYHGGEVALSVFREIVEQGLPQLDVEPGAELRGAFEQISQPLGAGEAQSLARGETYLENEGQGATLLQGPQLSEGVWTKQIVEAASTNRVLSTLDLRGCMRHVAGGRAPPGLTVVTRRRTCTQAYLGRESHAGT
jgi:cell division protein FtsI (penicillin-binding protein 3)